MARQFESKSIDPENRDALSGAPRSRGNIRENDARNRRAERKNRDKFYIPPEMVPRGFSAEWKRKSVLGRPEDPEYQMELQEAGWRFASPEQFPTLVPEGHQGNTIERGGMVLMIRPANLTKDAHRLDNEEALGQVRDKLDEIGMTASGEAPRRVQTFSRGFDRPSRMVPDDDGGDDFSEIPD